MKDDFFLRWEELKVPVHKPGLKWLGARIPVSIWTEITTFFRQNHIKNKSEGLIWLYYGTSSGWSWMVPYQTTNGMTVKVDESKTALTDQLREQLPKDVIQFGSIHDHCNGGAFQSGVDSQDEAAFDGVHITLGKLAEPAMDFHVRVSYKDGFSNSSITDWVEMPEGLLVLPSIMREGVFKEYLARFFPPHDPQMDALIKERVSKPSYHNTTVTTGYGMATEAFTRNEHIAFQFSHNKERVVITESDKIFILSTSSHKDSVRFHSDSADGWWIDIEKKPYLNKDQMGLVEKATNYLEAKKNQPSTNPTTMTAVNTVTTVSFETFLKFTERQKESFFQSFQDEIVKEGHTYIFVLPDKKSCHIPHYIYETLFKIAHWMKQKAPQQEPNDIQLHLIGAVEDLVQNKMIGNVGDIIHQLILATDYLYEKLDNDTWELMGDPMPSEFTTALIIAVVCEVFLEQTYETEEEGHVMCEKVLGL